MKKDELLLTSVRNLYNKMAWLNNSDMKDLFGNYTSAEVHCVEYIGNNEDSNVTKLAEVFLMTRGAISKMSKKLIKKGAIEYYQKPENKKEVYFRLTEQGKAIFELHKDLHNGFRERDKIVYDLITDEQYNTIIYLITEFDKHLDEEIKKKGLEIKS